MHRFRLIVAMGAVILAAVSLAIAHQSPPPHASSAEAAQYHVAQPRLTAAEVSTLEQLDAAQAAQLTQALNGALGKIGLQGGIGAGSGTRPGATLDAYTWSVGFNLTHAWVTASYANLWPYKQAINKIGDWADAAGSACGALAGYEIYGQAAEDVCDAMAGTIAWLASRVNFPDTSSHGVWDTFYWYPWGYSQSGYW